MVVAPDREENAPRPRHAVLSGPPHDEGSAIYGSWVGSEQSAERDSGAGLAGPNPVPAVLTSGSKQMS